MFIFGALALLLGSIGLIRPELPLSLLGFSVLDRMGGAAGDYTNVFMTATSMASSTMGVYCILAAANNIKNAISGQSLSDSQPSLSLLPLS